jgi:hypothetical protein
MADEDDSEEPAVTLGEGTAVEGAPLARIAARFMWGIEKSTIVEREGETDIRTPDGPRELGDVLAEVDEPYFSTRQEFVDAVEAVIGTGPVPTAEPTPDEDAEETAEAEEADDADGTDETGQSDDEESDDE